MKNFNEEIRKERIKEQTTALWLGFSYLLVISFISVSFVYIVTGQFAYIARLMDTLLIALPFVIIATCGIMLHHRK